MIGDITSKKVSSSINLREEIREFMNATEYQVLLQRVSQRIKCTCYKDEFTESSNYRCPKCFGSGYLCKFTKHKTFKQDTIKFSSHIFYANVGEMSVTPKTWFFEHDVHPQKGDYIWEVTWNARTGKPIQLLNLYKITEAGDMRGELGRIEYYSVWAELENIDKDFKGMYIGKAWRDIG